MTKCSDTRPSINGRTLRALTQVPLLHELHAQDERLVVGLCEVPGWRASKRQQHAVRRCDGMAEEAEVLPVLVLLSFCLLSFVLLLLSLGAGGRCDAHDLGCRRVSLVSDGAGPGHCRLLLLRSPGP